MESVREKQLPEETLIEHTLFSVWVVRLNESGEIISRATLVVHQADLLQESQVGEIRDIIIPEEYQEIDPASWILQEIISSAQVNNLLSIRVFIRPDQVEIRKLCEKFDFVRVTEPTGSEHIEEHCYQLDLQP